MYKFLSCEWYEDWTTINIDGLAQFAAETGCRLRVMDWLIGENTSLATVLGFGYPSVENLVFFVERSGFRKCYHWKPIAAEEFLKGDPQELDFSEEGQAKTIANLKAKRHDDQSFNGQNREFHQRLKIDWKGWPVFYFDWDWNIDRLEAQNEKQVMKQRWQKMYDAAKELNSLLGFISIPKKTVLSRRLFLPLSTARYLRPYLEYSAPWLPVESWSQIERKDIPNRVRTHAWIGGWIIAIE